MNNGKYTVVPVRRMTVNASVIAAAVLHGCGSENLVRVIFQLELAQIFIDIIIYGDILRD
jgi:hypothetical protein